MPHSYAPYTRSNWAFTGNVHNYLHRAAEAGRSSPLPEELTDEVLEDLLFPAKKFPSDHPQPDRAEVDRRFSLKGVILGQALHDYRKAHLDGCGYRHYCALYNEWSSRHKVTLRLHHKAGEQLFVDYAGDTIEVIDPETGKVRKAQISVATLGRSNYTLVEATPDQKIRSRIGEHRRI